MRLQPKQYLHHGYPGGAINALIEPVDEDAYPPDTLQQSVEGLDSDIKSLDLQDELSNLRFTKTVQLIWNVLKQGEQLNSQRH